MTPIDQTKCIHCGNPVGNDVFTACDECWDKYKAITKLMNETNMDYKERCERAEATLERARELREVDQAGIADMAKEIDALKAQLTLAVEALKQWERWSNETAPMIDALGFSAATSQRAARDNGRLAIAAIEKGEA